MELKAKSLSARTYEKKLGRLEAFAFPHIGKLPITSIAASQLLTALRRIEERGKHETAHRVRAECIDALRDVALEVPASNSTNGGGLPR